jgi:hypothetical protein
MGISFRAMTAADGLFRGAAILSVGLINLVKPACGASFLEMISSVYSWFHASRSFVDIVNGTIEGAIA